MAAHPLRAGGPTLTVALLVLGLASLQAQAPRVSTTQPTAIVAEVDGIIHPISAEFMIDVLERADKAEARLVVFVLRTPGGLVDSTRTIISRMIESRTPVAVFVAPSGARAASAGFLILLAGDVAAMAPGTHIGAAHPVQGGGGASDQKTSETMEKKIAADLAAYARTLAESRGRNVTLAESAVLESRAFTNREAAEAQPPLVEVIAPDVPDLLRQLHGRSVKRFDGRMTTLDTSGVQMLPVEMSARQRFLGAIANPELAYMLLSLGLLGLTIELWNPGAILPGVVGGLALLVALFALQILSVNGTGLLLIVLGMGLLVLEIKVASFGVLGIGGAISLLLGSIMLTSSVPGVRVNLSLIVPFVIGISAVMLFLGRLALMSQRRAPVTGIDGLIRAQARALTSFEPGQVGTVAVHGEIWRATAGVPIGEGQAVRITAVDGLTLRVESMPDAVSRGSLP
jgi:membrane-bound serine protease (ClpP class)